MFTPDLYSFIYLTSVLVCFSWCSPFIFIMFVILVIFLSSWCSPLIYAISYSWRLFSLVFIDFILLPLPLLFLCCVFQFTSALVFDHLCPLFTLLYPISLFYSRFSNQFITFPWKLPPTLTFFHAVTIFSHFQFYHCSWISFLPLCLSFSSLQPPAITFISLFISSHFTSCFPCEVSAISTQLASCAPCFWLSSILLLDMKRDTSATTVTAGRSMKQRQLKASGRAARTWPNRKKNSNCVDRPIYVFVTLLVADDIVPLRLWRAGVAQTKLWLSCSPDNGGIWFRVVAGTADVSIHTPRTLQRSVHLGLGGCHMGKVAGAWSWPFTVWCRHWEFFFKTRC